MSRFRYIGLLFALALSLPLVLPWVAAGSGTASARCKANSFDPSALRGDKVGADWRVYKNAKNGLSFRYPASMRVQERDPVPFHFDKVPDVIVDLRADGLNNSDFIVMRFICDRGEITPEMAAARASALRGTLPEEDPTGRVSDGAVGSMQVDGLEAIISCGCGRAACDWSVLTLQPRECHIFPMESGENGADSLLPPHDGEFPLLSIINTVHFESATNK